MFSYYRGNYTLKRRLSRALIYRRNLTLYKTMRTAYTFTVRNDFNKATLFSYKFRVVKGGIYLRYSDVEFKIKNCLINLLNISVLSFYFHLLMVDILTPILRKLADKRYTLNLNIFNFKNLIILKFLHGNVFSDKVRRRSINTVVRWGYQSPSDYNSVLDICSLLAPIQCFFYKLHYQSAVKLSNWDWLTIPVTFKRWKNSFTDYARHFSLYGSIKCFNRLDTFTKNYKNIGMRCNFYQLRNFILPLQLHYPTLLNYTLYYTVVLNNFTWFLSPHRFISSYILNSNVVQFQFYKFKSLQGFVFKPLNSRNPQTYINMLTLRYVEFLTNMRSYMYINFDFYSFLNSLELIQLSNSYLKLVRTSAQFSTIFFLAEFLDLFYMFFKVKDSTLLVDYIQRIVDSLSIWDHKKFFIFIFNVFREHFYPIFKYLNVVGLKITIRGKVSVTGNSRKRSLKLLLGETSINPRYNAVNYTNKILNTNTGVLGIQIWLVYTN